MPAPAAATDVLDFWFGAPGSAEHGMQRKAWFVKDPAFDAQITARFATTLEAALAGALRDWDATAAGALARIIVLDQFTRNAFRATARAFAGDVLALAAAQALLARGDDLALPPQQRLFAYLPFEHAEDPLMQAVSLRCIGALAAQHEGFDATLDYARRHQAVIARFGRYPHRNAALGRASTAEEAAFLREPGSGF